MNQNLDIQEFFVEGKDQSTSHVLLHIAEPVTPEEKQKGYFFALAEVENGYTEQITQLQEIIDTIETQYYSEVTDAPDTHLEHILQNINRQSHHIVQYEGSAVHCIAGVIIGQHIAVAYHGKPGCTLYYQGKEGLEETSVIEPEADGGISTQLFSSIVEGDMNVGDYLVCVTPHVQGFFPSHRIRTLLSSRSPRQAMGHIQKVLHDMNSVTSFGGMMFHVPKVITAQANARTHIGKGAGSEASLNQFLTSAQTTEETLSPPLFKNITKRAQEMIRSKWGKQTKETREMHIKKHEKVSAHVPQERIETNYRRAKERTTDDSVLNRILIILGKGLVILFTGLYIVLRKTAEGIWYVLRTLFFLITNAGGSRETLLVSWRSYTRQKKMQVQQLTLLHKILFLAALILLILFTGSIVYLKVREYRETRQSQYEYSLSLIQDKKEMAEAKLIYKEEDAARELLHDAQRMIEALPTDNKKQTEKKQELNADIESILMRLRKLTSVESRVLADLTQSEAQAHADHLLFFADTLMAYGTGDNHLYHVNPATGSIEKQSHETIKNLIAAAPTREEDKIIFVSSPQAIVEYTVETRALSPKTITYPTDEINVASVGTYNRNVYILDTQHNAVYKHSPTQTGYDKGASWIQDGSIDIRDGVSLAIDGSIYILKQNGTIEKFLSGKREDFAIQGLEPALTKPSALVTTSDMDHIYILEPEQKRIVVLTKDGLFVSQYTSSVWTNPVAIAISEQNKKIYVLDSNKIYEFTM